MYDVCIHADNNDISNQSGGDGKMRGYFHIQQSTRHADIIKFTVLNYDTRKKNLILVCDK